jgi:hypothetical protein
MDSSARKKEQAMYEKENIIADETSPWASSILETLGKSAPQFKNKTEAIQAFSSELNTIATNRSMSVTELLDFAGSSIENHEDLDRALKLSSLLYAFKNL